MIWKTNFSDFHGKLKKKKLRLYFPIEVSEKEQRNITVKIRSFYQIRILQYFCIPSFSNSDPKNRRVPNFI